MIAGPWYSLGAAYCAQAQAKGTAGMLDMLTSIAERGFARFTDPDDPRVKMITEEHVGGAVGISTSTPGMPHHFWTDAPDCTSIVVPSNQAMRMLLASELRRQAAVEPQLL